MLATPLKIQEELRMHRRHTYTLLGRKLLLAVLSVVCSVVIILAGCIEPPEEIPISPDYRAAPTGPDLRIDQVVFPDEIILGENDAYGTDDFGAIGVDELQTELTECLIFNDGDETANIPLGTPIFLYGDNVDTEVVEQYILGVTKFQQATQIAATPQPYNLKGQFLNNIYGAPNGTYRVTMDFNRTKREYPNPAGGTISQTEFDRDLANTGYTIQTLKTVSFSGSVDQKVVIRTHGPTDTCLLVYTSGAPYVGGLGNNLANRTPLIVAEYFESPEGPLKYCINAALYSNHDQGETVPFSTGDNAALVRYLPDIDQGEGNEPRYLPAKFFIRVNMGVTHLNSEFSVLGLKMSGALFPTGSPPFDYTLTVSKANLDASVPAYRVNAHPLHDGNTNAIELGRLTNSPDVTKLNPVGAVLAWDDTYEADEYGCIKSKMDGLYGYEDACVRDSHDYDWYSFEVFWHEEISTEE